MKKAMPVLKKVIGCTMFVFGIIFFISFLVNFNLKWFGPEGSINYYKATVIEINDNTVISKVGENNGDPIIYEFENKKSYNLKENDTFYVKKNSEGYEYKYKTKIINKIEKISSIIMLGSIAVIVFFSMIIIFFQVISVIYIILSIIIK